VDRITRKQLKSDDFAIQVEHTVEFFDEHRKQAIQYGAAAAVVVLLVVGGFAYSRQQHKVREQAMTVAYATERTPVGAQAPSGRTLSTPGEKTAAVIKAYTDVAGKYPGSDQGVLAEYRLGAIAADDGDLELAGRHYQKAVDSKDGNFASLAALALADIYKSQGKMAEAEKLLRGLIDKPSDFVSKDEATIALARLIAQSRPEEAKKLLDPYINGHDAVSRTAGMAMNEVKK